MKILYQYASRCRPARFFEGLRSILDNQIDEFQFLIHAVLDIDDPTIDASFIKEMGYFDSILGEKIIWNFGQSKGKIDAINRPLPNVDWDILVNTSDDMRFIVEGFDDIIRVAFLKHGLDSFIHFPDQDAGEALPTMSIMGRKYYERDSYIYHSNFISLWADNFAMEMAKKRLCYRFEPDRLFNHELPATGYGKHDAQSIFQQSFFYTDQKTYEGMLAKIEDYL